MKVSSQACSAECSKSSYAVSVELKNLENNCGDGLFDVHLPTTAAFEKDLFRMAFLAATPRSLWQWLGKAVDMWLAFRRRRRILLRRLLLASFLGSVFLLLLVGSNPPPADSQPEPQHLAATDLNQLDLNRTVLPLRIRGRPAQHRKAAREVSEDFTDARPDTWRRANPDSRSHQLFVYSAYFDNRTQPGCVRIIGTTLTKSTAKVVCSVKEESGSSIVLAAHKKPLNEHWNLLYAGFLFSCCAKQFLASPPQEVTVFEEPSSNVSVTLLVHRNAADPSNPKGEFALCIKPFHYSFNRAVQLIEFVEFYRLLGVEHFFFYNDTVGPEVQKILLNYKEKALATILPWSMQVKSQKEIRTENMFSALNDCIYRVMYAFKYVVSVDLDEFIVPKAHQNLSSLISSLSQPKKAAAAPCASSYIIPNVFFYLYWENDTSLFQVEPETHPRYVPYLLTQYKTRRLEKPHKHGQRSKYIADPTKVLEAGNHVTWRHTGDCKSVRVPSSVALLHHYRICEYGGFQCLKAPSLLDRSAQRFGIQLMTQVLLRCYQVFPQFYGQCPVTPALGSPW